MHAGKLYHVFFPTVNVRPLLYHGIIPSAMGLLASTVLMENAGRAVVSTLLHNYPNVKRCIILCGSGNNGGDGLVVARVLHKLKIPTLTFMLAKDHHALSPDCRHQLQLIEEFGGSVVWLSESTWKKELPELTSNDVIVDAIFGVGFTPGAIKGWRADVILHISPPPCPVISIDIPSGLHPDETTLPEIYIQADHTTTFGPPRHCHVFFPAAKACGKIHIAEIGLSHDASVLNIIYPHNLPALAQRSSDTHKYDYGHVLIVAGSHGMPGAAVLAAKGALASGAGLVSIKTTPDCVDVIVAQVPQAMVTPYISEDEIVTYINTRKVSEIVVGPGQGRTDLAKLIVTSIINITLPLILDADALNILASDPILQDAVRTRTAPTILTPHYGEASRLLDLSSDEIHNGPIKAAQLLATKLSAVVVLKGARSIIAFPDQSIWVSTVGNPGMSTGGSGDVLAGILSSFIHQAGVGDGVRLGCYAHGASGDLAAVLVGQNALSPLDIIDHLPQALAEIKRQQCLHHPTLIETL